MQESDSTETQNEELTKAFQPLYADLGVKDVREIPLLAHYTSTVVMESILKNEEIWLANPLYMNDHEEIGFGVIEGRAKVISSSKIKEAFTDERFYEQFQKSYYFAYAGFAEEQALDIFVLCFSEHHKLDIDGRLSLWRSYGADASGACIVFDPTKIETDADVPFVFLKVAYAPKDSRLSMIDAIIDNFCSLLKALPQSDFVAHHAAYCLFDRILLFSLFNKHIGFSEEDEWRLVYRRNIDEKNNYSGMIGYWLGKRGIEPKLKLKLRTLADFQPNGLELDQVVDRILLGPTATGTPSMKMVQRMLDLLGKSRLRNRVHSSSIPYRPTS